MNTQRKIIYEQRRQVLDGEDLQKSIASMMQYYVESYVTNAFAGQPHLEDRQAFFALMSHFENICFPKGAWIATDEELQTMDAAQMTDRISDMLRKSYEKKEAQYGSPVMRELERVITLRVVDEYWMDHIDAMDDLRQGIRLRAYAQTDPVIEYKREGFDMFEAMTNAIKRKRSSAGSSSSACAPTKRSSASASRRSPAKAGQVGDKTVKRQPVVKKVRRSARTTPCPCGSGKKYKKCCRDKDLAAEQGKQA